MGFIPIYCKDILNCDAICFPGLVNPNGVNVKINPRELARRKRDKCLHERNNKYNDLARPMNDVRKWLRERSVTCWRIGDGNLAEWHEYKGDDFFEFVDFCEREATKTFKELRGDRSEES